MKFKIIRSKFLDGLRKVQNIVGTKSTIQITQNVLLEVHDNKLYLTTTDIDISVRSIIPCEEVMVEGTTTLPVKVLANSIAKMPEMVMEISVDEQDRAEISAGDAMFEIAGMSSVDFPQLPKDAAAFAYEVPQITLREMLRKTSYAVAQDDSRKTLKGLLFSLQGGKLTMVGTDGRRLALVEHEVEYPDGADKDVTLPQKVVSELLRTLTSESTVKITIENTQISFNLGDTRIYSKLMDDVYPNYRQVIPTDYRERVTVDRELLLSALDRASVMLSIEETSSTRLTFENNQLIVSAAATDKGKVRDIVPIKYEGERIEIVFNPQYLIEPLKAIDEDEIIMELTDGRTPAIMRCHVPFLYVMMPLRIN